MKDNLILITGVPGMGKTEIGEYLNEKYGYNHINFELPQFAPPTDLEQFKIFFQNLPKDNKIVITWGFGSSLHKNHIDYIVSKGYNLIWFDGNRVASFREFMRREKSDAGRERAYYSQLLNIIKTKIVEQINPKLINTFDQNGNFKNKEIIVSEILQ